MGDLSENFDTTEFACHCGCGYATPSYKLVARLQEIRDRWGYPIRVHSGCRCYLHNSSDSVLGGRNSYHLNGMAADIAPQDSAAVENDKEWIRGHGLTEFHRICKDVFDGNGIIFYPVKKFVHVDIRGYRYLPFPVTS